MEEDPSVYVYWRATHQDSVLHFITFDLKFDFLLKHQLDFPPHCIPNALWNKKRKIKPSITDQKLCSVCPSNSVLISFHIKRLRIRQHAI